MIRLLRFLITGDWHLHNWETIEHANLTQDGFKVGIRYFQRCTVCGKVHKVDLC